MNHFTLRLETAVRVTQNEDDAQRAPIPTPEQVVDAFREYTEDSLISYKALAESRDLPASVEMTIVKAEIVQDMGPPMRMYLFQGNIRGQHDCCVIWSTSEEEARKAVKYTSPNFQIESTVELFNANEDEIPSQTTIVLG